MGELHSWLWLQFSPQACESITVSLCPWTTISCWVFIKWSHKQKPGNSSRVFLEAAQLSAGSQCVFSKGEKADCCLTEGKGLWGEFSPSLGQSHLYTCPDPCHQTWDMSWLSAFLCHLPGGSGHFSNSQGPYVYIMFYNYLDTPLVARGCVFNDSLAHSGSPFQRWSRHVTCAVNNCTQHSAWLLQWHFSPLR